MDIRADGVQRLKNINISRPHSFISDSTHTDMSRPALSFSSLWSAATPSKPPVLEDDSPAERAIIATLKGKLDTDIESLAASIPGDPYAQVLLGRGTQLDESLARYLRYNSHDVEKAERQVRAFVRWREQNRVGSLKPQVMRGLPAGLPVRVLNSIGKGRTRLLFTSARHYVKKALVSDAHEKGVARIFDELLYYAADDGLPARAAVVVVDFEGVTLSMVDLTTMKRDIQLFLAYYPETFHKFLFVAYPKIILTFWNLVRPLLDERTLNTIEWCEHRAAVTDKLGAWFSIDQIPNWLGGTLDVPLDLLCGVPDAKAAEEELKSKFSTRTE